MYAQLVNHNDDLRCLEEKGYAIAFDSNYLIVRDIPYLDSAMSLRIGAIVTKLVFVDRITTKQDVARTPFLRHFVPFRRVNDLVI